MTNPEKPPYRGIEIHHGKYGVHGEHGLPRERLSFRVFRDFRGSCCFRGFRAFRGSVLFIAILAAFAFLLAAAPALAQSPATLLDIKSPATTSPPNESLLTLDEAGDLWIKGHLYDYAFQSTITLDPAKKYWTLRDTTGKIVWALEVYNPASGASTGDLYSIGSFEGWAVEPDQTGAILRYTNASAEVVFSLSAAGEARARRTAPQRGTPAPWPDPPALGPIPDSSADPPVIIPTEAVYGSKVGKIVPEPLPQGRIFYSVSPYWPVGADRDVTGASWRRRWEPAITTLRDYGVHLGCRQRDGQNQSQWLYWGANDAGIFTEFDAGVVRSNGTLYLYYPSCPQGWFTDGTWTLSSVLPTPPTTIPPRQPLTFGMTWNDYQPGNWDYNTGDSLDTTPTLAQTRLFLYWMEFDTTRTASAVPRKDGDRWMNVRCCLQPRPIPEGWINHIELTVWDPAYVDTIGNGIRRRKIIGDPGQDCISVMWDGKLYDNESGQPDPIFPWLTPFYYTEASDVFMKATVFWNPLSPSRPWENVDGNSFDEPRVAIVVWGIWPGGSLEPGQLYSFQTATNALPDAITAYQWDFEGKAFQNVDQETYDDTQLLTFAQKTTANVTTKFITGSKYVPETRNLGVVNATLELTDAKEKKWRARYPLELMVHEVDPVPPDAPENYARAEITPYFVPYEVNSFFRISPMDTPMSVRDPQTGVRTTYYFGADFAGEITMQGTIKPYKLRTQSGLTKNDGVDPTPAQQYIIYGTGVPTFSSTVSVSNQDAARFKSGEHRSYYCAGSYVLTNVYHIASDGHPEQRYTDLAGYVNSRRSWFTQGNPPLEFQSSAVTIKDTGPFESIPRLDEKHIDIFYQSSGEMGIHKLELFRAYGQAWATVRRP